MPLLFTYGTLRSPDVQQRLLGRTLSGSADRLAGFERSTMPVSDAAERAVVDSDVYHVIVPSTAGQGSVDGMVFEVSNEELAVLDLAESRAGYGRSHVVLVSGTGAWVYLRTGTDTGTSRFGPDPVWFFSGVYTQSAPWDIGAPQPSMMELLDAFPPSGPVLDAGCGTGDLTLALAAQGVTTIGVDFIPSAIAEAEQRRMTLPAAVAAHARFLIADARHPSGIGSTFGAVVDSGFLHLFNEEECRNYLSEVALVLPPGGRFYLHEFAVEFPVPNMPRSVTQEDLLRWFTPALGWNVLTVRSAEFLSRVAPPVPATLACIERVAS